MIHHHVAPGDNLTAIAKQHGSTVEAIRDANERYWADDDGVLHKADPNQIREGDVLHVPVADVEEPPAEEPPAEEPPPDEPPDEPPEPPAELDRVDVRNFTKGGSGGVYAYLVPNGFENKHIVFVPGTSTKTPPAVKGQTTPFRVAFVGGGNEAQKVSGLVVRNSIVDGEGVGHLVHGLTVGYSDGALLEDLLIASFYGTDSSPPWETFGLEFWRADNATARRVRVANSSNPESTMFGANDSRDFTLDACDLRFNDTGFAVAIWECFGDNVFRACKLGGGRRAVNIEENGGADSFLFDRCDFTGVRDPTRHVQISSTRTQGGPGSSKIKFNEPIVEPGRQFRITNLDPGVNGSLQRHDDIEVILNGKPYVGPCDTPEVRIGHYW